MLTPPHPPIMLTHATLLSCSHTPPTPLYHASTTKQHPYPMLSHTQHPYPAHTYKHHTPITLTHTTPLKYCSHTYTHNTPILSTHIHVTPITHNQTAPVYVPCSHTQNTSTMLVYIRRLGFMTEGPANTPPPPTLPHKYVHNPCTYAVYMGVLRGRDPLYLYRYVDNRRIADAPTLCSSKGCPRFSQQLTSE